MDSYRILPFLGLCLRGGNLAVGEEVVESFARAKKARVLLLSSDASDRTRRRAERFSQVGNCPLVPLPFSKAEVGAAVGRPSVALTAVTDMGMADALVRKLRPLDEALYAGPSELLAKKAERMAKRRAEKLRHEKNVRRGAARKQRGPSPKKAEASPLRTPPSGKGEVDRNARGGQSRSGKRTGGGRFAHSRPVRKGKGSERKNGR